jgi:hypothetical protein
MKKANTRLGRLSSSVITMGRKNACNNVKIIGQVTFMFRSKMLGFTIGELPDFPRTP